MIFIFICLSYSLFSFLIVFSASFWASIFLEAFWFLLLRPLSVSKQFEDELEELDSESNMFKSF